MQPRTAAILEDVEDSLACGLGLEVAIVKQRVGTSPPGLLEQRISHGIATEIKELT